MKWYTYLNYRIYNYYDKRQDSPVISSLLTMTLLAFINVFSIHTIYSFITDFWAVQKLLPNYKIIITFSIIILILIHYFLFYHKRKHINIFKEFKENADKYRKWNFLIKLYIFGSIGVCLITLIIVDLRNHNFELYFLK